MRSIHSLVGDNLKEAARAVRRKYEVKKELPDYPIFKVDVIAESRMLANNNLPQGTARNEFVESFELAIKRTSENMDFGLSQIIESAYKTLKSNKKLSR
jgi:hypothetical protein